MNANTILSEKNVSIFRKKWMPTHVQELVGDYWTRTPSRIYWVMLYEGISGEDLYNMSKDLLEFYDENSRSCNSSIKHALSVVDNIL